MKFEREMEYRCDDERRNLNIKSFNKSTLFYNINQSHQELSHNLIKKKIYLKLQFSLDELSHFGCFNHNLYHLIVNYRIEQQKIYRKKKINSNLVSQATNKNQMSMSQSKLMLQLTKQQKVQQKVLFNEQKIQDLYATISKLQPKNLMLVEFLTLMIEKNLIKNSHKIETFVEMYEEIKGKKLQQEHNSFTMMNNRTPNATTYSTNSANMSNNNNNSSMGNNNNTQTVEKEEQKFNKKKFLKLLKDVAKMLYPSDPRAYEVTLYLKLIMPQQQENRMKVDDNLKRFLNEETITNMARNNKELQTLFEVYMPENYNSKLGFSWNEIRLLEKKLPMTCLLRILFEAEICPQLLSPIQFLEIVSKMIPPLNSNHKEVMFYYSETFNSYMREHIFNDEIKLLEGDIGLTFLEFSMIVARIATEVWKDGKQQIPKAVQRLMNQFGITDIIKNKKEMNKMTKMQSVVLAHFKEAEKKAPSNNGNNARCLKKKTYFKKENQELMTLLDESDSDVKKSKTSQDEVPYKKLQHESMLITRDDLSKIKRNLDDQLGPIPQKVQVDKENEGYFNVNEKFTVIGEQLPKIQDKNKPAAKPNPKDKKEDPLFGFKPEEEPKSDLLTKSSLMLNRKKKLRLNTQHPVILSEVFYPTSFSDPKLIQLKEQQEIYIETTYIHLGERMYEQAYLNFQKAQRLMKNKKPGNYQMSPSDKKNALIMEFYLEILEAQIFEAAGKDEAAFVHYYNAREMSFNFTASEFGAKAYTYMGLSSTLYHLEEYEFALRCLLKAKQIYGDNLETESVENAILLNNIGSCYMLLNRNQEAVKYFNVSHQIFDLKVGRFDERTLVVQQNISKNKKAFIEQMPPFKTMWKSYVQKSTALTAAKTVKKVKK